MGTDFDDFVVGYQNQIFEETRAAYGDFVFQSRKPLITI
jgi:hypothetical protein